jgi:hypothetical protein
MVMNARDPLPQFACELRWRITPRRRREPADHVDDQQKNAMDQGVPGKEHPRVTPPG